MSVESSITRTEQFSGSLKSLLQQLRSMVGKPEVRSEDCECSTSDWGTLLNEAMQRSAALSQEGRDRRAAIAQIMQDADVDTRISIADCLLFASDLNQAHDVIMTRAQQRQVAA
jgi:hypothetical protein